MDDKKLGRYKVSILALGLALTFLAFHFQLWDSPASRLLFAVPGSAFTAAGILLLLLEFNRFRTHIRVLWPLSMVLMAAGGGMLCFLFVLSAVLGVLDRSMGLYFIVLGLPGVLFSVWALRRFSLQEEARRRQKKKRGRRKA